MCTYTHTYITLHYIALQYITYIHRHTHIRTHIYIHIYIHIHTYIDTFMHTYVISEKHVPWLNSMVDNGALKGHYASIAAFPTTVSGSFASLTFGWVQPHEAYCVLMAINHAQDAHVVFYTTLHYITLHYITFMHTYIIQRNMSTGQTQWFTTEYLREHYASISAFPTTV